MEQIGKYKIVEEIGRGGMGMVYKGRDTVIGRDVAIKILQEGSLNADTVKERFYREARSTGRLTHENITTIYDVGEHEGIPYLVMEYLEGDDLREIMRTGTPLSMREKLLIAVQICRGLQFAHEHGIIHRDIKPGNIRVLPDGLVKIMDFGIARIQSETLTLTNSIMGTPRYMSPEQITGGKIDHRTDIFSFGAMLYELLSGEVLFKGQQVTTVIYQVLHHDPPPLKLEPKDMSKVLQKIVMKCLTRDRDKRYQHFEDILKDLLPLAYSSTGPVEQTLAKPQPGRLDVTLQSYASVQASSTQDLSGWQRIGSRKKKVALALGALMMLTVVIGGYFAFSSSNDAPSTTPPPGETALTDPVPSTQAEGTPLSEEEGNDTPDALPSPERQASEQARRVMELNLQRVTNRRREAEVTALYAQAQELQQAGIDHADAEDFDEATNAFQEAGALYAQMEQILIQKDRAATAAATTQQTTPAPAQQPSTVDNPPQEDSVTEEPPTPEPVVETPEEPPSTGNPTQANQARQRMETAKNAVRAALHQSAPFQEGLSLERQGEAAVQARTFDQAAAHFDAARARFGEAASLKTPEEEANEAIQALTQRLKTSLEREDLPGMRAVHEFYNTWNVFFENAESIQAQVTTGAVAVLNTQATVEVHVQMEYRDNRNRPAPTQNLSYIWTLEKTQGTWQLTRVLASQ